MQSSYPKRVLRAKLFDALKAAAERFGGVGARDCYENRKSPTAPLCALGFLHYIGEIVLKPEEANDVDNIHEYTEVARQILGFSWPSNDNAVAEYFGTHHLTSAQRMPFSAWAEYFNLQRAVELPAEVFDALKASAEKNGGISYGFFSRYEGNQRLCGCISGHALAIDYGDPTGWDHLNGKHIGNAPTIIALATALGEEALRTLHNNYAPGVYDANDRAVRAINERKGVFSDAPVTFEEWAEELNVIRVVQMPAKLYDALQASAERFGGIGAGAFEDNCGQPLCAAGHIAGPNGDYLSALGDLTKTVGNYSENSSAAVRQDIAVRAINARKGVADLNARVSFEEWAQELNVDRVIVLEPQTYDALKASAEKFGGIGAGRYSDSDGPLCAAGHLAERFNGSTIRAASALDAELTLGTRGTTEMISDAAVKAINKRKGVEETSRVTFAEWTRELGVVRGDA